MARIFIGAIIGTVIVLAMGLTILSRAKPAPAFVVNNTASAGETTARKSDVKVIEYSVKEGDAWGRIAEQIGIASVLSEKLLAVSEETHSLTAIRAGNLFRFYFNPNLFKIVYDIDSENILIIEKGERNEFLSRKEKIDYDINIVTKHGVIESSLFETALAEGIPAGVILNMATILGWDIDFASSVQKDDIFVIAYEERFRDGKYAGSGRILAAKFINSGQEFYAFRYEDSEGIGRYYNNEGRELPRQFLRSPLDYTRITSGFSYNRFHPILDTFTTHRAIDYAASSGTPVSVTADGTVTFAGWNGGNGQFISVKHASGYSTGYAHLSAYANGIKAGAKVKQNQLIGFVGSTGLSTGPHLHYEMRKHGVLINPLRLDLPPGKMLSDAQLAEFSKERGKLLNLLSQWNSKF